MIDSLYELIGGRLKLQKAVDSFYRKVLADKNLSGFFSQVDMQHQHAGQSMFLAMLLGGRTDYTGQELGAAHDAARKAGLNDAHFDAFLNHFRAALGEVGVQSEHLDKVMALLEAKRSTVLNR
jgi:hemoglobin